MKQSKLRKFIRDIHLWLGLFSGIVLFIVCLSGTIYTFRSEIEYFIDPNKYDADIPSSQNVLAIPTLISNLEKEERGTAVSITIPEDKAKNYSIALAKKGNKKEANPQKGRPSTFYVDPYTGEIKGKDGGSTSEFFVTMMKLHRWLLLDSSIGRPIVGIATLVFLVLCVSGLILWFPKKLKYWKKISYWKPGFKIMWRSNWKRINNDLHNTLGFYSLIFLVIMSLTGLYWSFEWYKDAKIPLVNANFLSRDQNMNNDNNSLLVTVNNF